MGHRREVTPASPLTAAWGDPPVVVRCGVPVPSALKPESLLVTVNSVDWFPEELTGGAVITTVGRKVALELTVPAKQGNAPEVAVELAAAIKSLDPLIRATH